MAGLADFLMTDIQADLRAADRLPEIDIERVLEIGAALGRRRFFFLHAAAEELREEVAKAAAGRLLAGRPPRTLPRASLGLAVEIGKIEAAEPHSSLVRSPGSGCEAGVGIEALLIIH